VAAALARSMAMHAFRSFSMTVACLNLLITDFLKAAVEDAGHRGATSLTEFQSLYLVSATSTEDRLRGWSGGGFRCSSQHSSLNDMP
jgi:hypothetical protein